MPSPRVFEENEDAQYDLLTDKRQLTRKHMAWPRWRNRLSGYRTGLMRLRTKSLSPQHGYL